MFSLEAFIANQQKISAEATSRSKRNISRVTPSLSAEAEERNGNICLEKSSRKIQKETSSSGSEYLLSDEDYEPSSDEEDNSPGPSTSSCRVRQKKNAIIKKVVDDGDMDRFTARMKEWKANKTKKSDSTVSLCSNKNIHNDEDYHEISGCLRIPNVIWKQLYRYQKTGVKWLWELHQIESGGLLGDEMGLGKTIQIIAFLAGLSITRKGVWGGLGPTIIVAPATVLHQWVEHFHHWWPPFRVGVLHNSGSHQGSAEALVRDINNHHGILVTTYNGIVQHKAAFETKKWHYCILDEGHKIRNSDTQVSKAVRNIRTPHRLVVTGSPMQNNLQELWSIFDFMSPGLLGSLQAFVDNFATPITQGGYTNATRFQETTALSLATTLKDIITPYMLRRTKAEVKEYLKLPEKKEQVLFCNLTDEQKNLYKSFLLSDTVRSIINKERRFGENYRAKVLVGLTTLRKICNHPDLYLHEVDESSNVPVGKQFANWKKAGKMIVLNSLLKIWKKQNHRALIFTQSRAMICILELFLEQNDYKYLKMDGTVSIGSRQPLINTFNNDESYLVFLATTRVGGLGINLTGADRVIIYDPDWNPAIDGQAKERAWRIGQSREVTIYRLLSIGTVEEKIYQKQVFKHLLGNKVFLDPNQKNYLKTTNLQGLFSLEEPENGETETTSIFKHTQVHIHKAKDNKGDECILNGGVSFSKTKLNAMRRLAQEISKKITQDSKEAEPEPEDPRERYKKKLQPSPPPHVPPLVNIIDDKETNVDFGTILSEIDFVSKYTKPEPHDFLRLNSNNELEDGEIEENSNQQIEQNTKKLKNPEPSVDEAIENSPDQEKKSKLRKKLKNRSNMKRKKRMEDLLNEEGLGDDKEFLNNVQKVKKKKQKEENDAPKDSDEYVLGKLFAKGVQSALQHDKVVGLAEREERHKMQTSAQQVALRALKNLKKSRLDKWRW